MDTLIDRSWERILKLPIGARLIGVGAAVPKAIVTNADLEAGRHIR